LTPWVLPIFVVLFLLPKASLTRPFTINDILAGAKRSPRKSSLGNGWYSLRNSFSPFRPYSHRTTSSYSLQRRFYKSHFSKQLAYHMYVPFAQKRRPS
jgi:hypothetical protein